MTKRRRKRKLYARLILYKKNLHVIEQVAKKNFVSTYRILARDNFETNENTEDEERRKDFLEATSIYVWSSE